MPIILGDLRHKSTILKRADQTFDVKNPLTQWVPVVENYYVDMTAQSTEEHLHTGQTWKFEVYTILGHYVEAIRPGMKIEVRGKVMDITHAVDQDGYRAMLTITAKVAA